MNRDDRIIDDMRRLLTFFAPRCADRTTLDALDRMLSDDRGWPRAHDLFDQIRTKTLVAEATPDQALAAQDLFEEACAKTLYNLSYSSAPFDADSPYWIVPNAFALARSLQIDETLVLQIVSA